MARPRSGHCARVDPEVMGLTRSLKRRLTALMHSFQ